jgi:hypothetical protein
MNLNSASELMEHDQPMQSQDAINSLEVEAETSPIQGERGYP